MSLKQQLLEDMKAAMKEKDSVKKDAIQMVRTSILQTEKDNRITLEDDGVIEIIAKEVKKRKGILPEYEKSGRQDLIEKLKYEIDVLTKYLPQQLTEDELEKIVREVVREIGAGSPADIGRTMKEVLPKVSGRADGKTVNEIVKRILK
jgi:uncharacterized protein YqeY